MKKKIIPIALIAVIIIAIIAFSVNSDNTVSEKKDKEDEADLSSAPLEDTDVSLSLIFGGNAVLSAAGGEGSDESVQSLLVSADFAWVENECAYSDMNTPLLLSELGINIAGTANECVFSGGDTSLDDTLSALSFSGLEYTGAGYNISDATTPAYFSVGDITTAYISAANTVDEASAATDDLPGVFRYTDASDLTEKISEAGEVADVVICLPHWSEPDKSLAHALIDAGADIVVGTHGSSFSGMEIYNDKPIFYNLGNFISSENGDGILVSFTIDATKTVSGGGTSLDVKKSTIKIIPVLQTDGNTTLAEGAALQEALDRFKSESTSEITINSDGTVAYD